MLNNFNVLQLVFKKCVSNFEGPYKLDHWKSVLYGSDDLNQTVTEESAVDKLTSSSEF